MEQAFIRIKLLAGDMSDIQQKIKKLQSDLKIQFDNRQMGDFKNSIKDFVSSIGSFGDIATNIAKFVYQKAEQNVATGMSEYESAKEGIIERKSYANLLGTDDLATITALQNAFKQSGARNPFMMLSNFMNKLQQARTGEDRFLEDYAGMDNLTALMTLMQRLQSGKISAEDKSTALREIFGSVYGDNMERMLGSVNIEKIIQDNLKTLEDIYRTTNKEELNKRLKLLETSQAEGTRKETAQKTKYDLQREKTIYDETTWSGQENKFVDNLIERRQKELDKNISALETFSASISMTEAKEESKRVISLLADGLISGFNEGVIQPMKELITGELFKNSKKIDNEERGE